MVQEPKKSNNIYLTLLFAIQVTEITLILILIIMFDFVAFDNKAEKWLTDMNMGNTLAEVVEQNRKELTIKENTLNGELELSIALKLDSERKEEEQRLLAEKEAKEIEQKQKDMYKGFNEVGTDRELTTVIDDEEQETESEVSETQLLEQLFSNSDVIFDGNIDSSVKLKACQVWSSIPNRIRGDFLNNNWSIVVTDDDLAEKYDMDCNIVGCTVQAEQTIYLINDTRAIDKALLHEMGHYVDLRADYSSQSVEFSNIYLAEREKLFEVNKTDDYAQTSEEEYFAEAFQQIMKRPDMISVATPNTFNYIANIINRTFN